MAYEPTQWQTGDVIDATKLNKAEQGIAEATAYIIPATYAGEGGTPPLTLDASYNDIIEKKGCVVIAQEDYSDDPSDPGVENYYLTDCYVDSGKYYANFIGFVAGEVSVTLRTFTAETADAPLTLPIT